MKYVSTRAVMREFSEYAEILSVWANRIKFPIVLQVT